MQRYRFPYRQQSTAIVIAFWLLPLAFGGRVVHAQGTRTPKRVPGATVWADTAARPIRIKDEHHRLATARVGLDSARRIALVQVPGGRVTSAELEKEDGILTYEFIVLERGGQSIAEVEVDAQTGKVGAVEYVRGATGRRRAKLEREKH